MDIHILQVAAGLIGALLGAGAIVVANHFEHEHRLNEERSLAERQMYIRLMQQVRRLQTITHRGVTPDERPVLNEEIAVLRGEADVLASDDVREAASSFFDVMSSIADMDENERKENIVVLDASILPLLDAIRTELGTGGIFKDDDEDTAR